MSGLKPQPLTEFYRSLAARGLSTQILAETLGVSTATLSRKIAGCRARRGLAWRGLWELLNEREKSLLEQVSNSSAWNLRQSARRPRWDREKSADLAETYPGKFSGSVAA